MRELPTGTATFLFSDIEGSTRLLRSLGDGYDDVLVAHNRLLRSAWASNNGHEVGTEGDSFFVAFSNASDAVRAALAAQHHLLDHEWPPGGQVQVRIGIHTGEARVISGEYIGLAVHEAARISSAAHGGQIVLSRTTYDLVKDALPDGAILIDLGDHHLKDIPDAARLFQLCSPPLPTEFPRLRTLDVRKHNLPAQLTTFIGREDDVAVVRELIASSRLTTLTAAGGSGKTRLALEVAAQLLGEYRDGVRLVDLAPLTDPDLVGQTVASAVGVREQESKTIESALEDYFAGKEMLLLLDNCEHLVRPCADLAERLLKIAPDLKILVTTREALGVDGEAAWRVPSLTLPEAGIETPDEVLRCTAVKLFVDRAASVDASFSPSDRDVVAISHICRRLDGIPLAIELAAARTEVLTPTQIADRLDDRFRLLTGGKRTALARQQTLRALVDWSYDLLDDAERSMLDRLSVFAGGATLNAIEAVCVGGEVDNVAILDLLAQLVRKSLVIADKDQDGVRYRLLETIRQYGREKLMASPDAIDVRTRHRDHFLELVERAESELEGLNQVRWLRLLDAELENIRAALEWSAADHTHPFMRLASAAWRFWWIRGLWTEGRTWLDAALSASDGTDAALEAKALWASAHLACFQGDDPAAYELAAMSLERATAAGDHRRRGYATFSIGYTKVTGARQDPATSRVFEGSLDIARSVGDEQLEGWSLLLLGSTGDPTDPARRTFNEEALELGRRTGDRWNTAMALNNLAAWAARRDGDTDAARIYLEESIASWRELGDSHGLAKSLANLGSVALSRGDRESAGRSLDEALRIMRDSGDRPGMSWILPHVAHITSAKGEHAEACALLKEAESLARARGDRGAVAGILNAIAWTLHLLGDDESAYVSARESVDLQRELQNDAILAPSLHTLGEIQRALGNVEDSVGTLRNALRLSYDTTQLPTVAACLSSLAGTAVASHDLDRAAHLFGAAEMLYATVDAERDDEKIYEKDLEALRGSLDGSTLDARWNEGRNAALDLSVALALDERGAHAPNGVT